jgi:ATP-dependent Clp protease ATP-binding subunit ClpA
VIQQEVEDSLSDALLGGEFDDCETIIIDVEEDEIVLRRSEKEPAPPEPTETEPMIAG